MSQDHIGSRPVQLDSLAAFPSALRGIFEEGESTVARLVMERGVPTDAASLLALEREVARVMGRLADQVVAPLLVLGERTVDTREEAWQELVDIEAARGLRLRDHGTRALTIRLLGGSSCAIQATYCAPDYSGRRGRRRKARGRSGAGCYPGLDQLGVIEGMTPALASEVARQSAALSSFEEARQSLATRAIDLDVKTVRRTSAILGDRVLRCRDERAAAFEAGTVLPSTGEFAGKRVAVVFDGGRTRTRVSGKRGRRRRKTRRRGFHTPWREPKKVVIYVFDDEGKKTDDAPVYEGSFETWEDAFRIFVAECARRGVADAKELVILADGSLNIWDHVDAFVAKLGIPPDRVQKIVDYYHAAKRVSDLADLCAGWSAKQRRAWVKHVLKHLRAGRIERVLEAGEALAVGRRGKAVNKALDYFRTRKDLMRYAQFRRRGLPIGSGVVESAIRRVVNLRLKGPGIFWEVDNAERMLVLRCYLKAGRWHEVEREAFSSVAIRHRGLKPRVRARAAA